MNKLRVIDLLNKIANGEEVPERIQVYSDIFVFDKYNRVYEHEETRTNLLSIYNGNILNYEVEIIEEEKKIPEKICTNRIINTKDILEFEMIQNKINAEYTYAINEIIDYLEEKE